MNESKLLAKYTGLYIYNDQDEHMYKLLHQMSWVAADSVNEKSKLTQERVRSGRKKAGRGEYYCTAQHVDDEGRVIEGNDEKNVNVWVVKDNPDFYYAVFTTKQPAYLRVRME